MTQQPDPQTLNHFVETLAPPLQQAMAEGSPRAVPDSIMNVVSHLEPEVEAAFRSGNSAVIQAVMGGANTTQMVVNDMIRQGVTTGLPYGVQQLVEQRLKEIEQQQANKNNYLREIAAGVVGMATMAGAAEGGMYYGGEGQQRNYMTNPPSSYEFSQMNAEQRAAYMDQVNQISADPAKWNSMTSEARTQTIANVNTQTDIRVGDAADRAADVTTRAIDSYMAKGETLEQAQVHNREVASEVRKWLDANPTKTVADYAGYIEKEDTKLSQDDKIWAVERAKEMKAHKQEVSTQMTAREAQRADQNGQIEESRVQTQKTTQLMNESNLQAALDADTVYAFSVLNGRNVSRTAAEANAAMEATEAARGEQAASVQATNTENLTVRASLDAKRASAELAQSTAKMDGYDEQPAAVRSATVDASPLGPNGKAGLSQLGTVPELVAANDAPELQRRPQAPSQGMGAGT